MCSSDLLERGFNQSERLASGFCRRLALTMDAGTLKCIKKTRDQVFLPREQRAENVKGAFVVGKPDSVLGKRILLVDDVMTTGSTLDEAARTLRNAGAKAVYGYTLARDI